MPLNVAFTIGPKHDITLGEIRELVEATADWNENIKLDVKHSSGGQREPSTSSITVRLP